MALEFGIKKNLFKHAKAFDQGMGNIRRGQATFIVALDGTGDFDKIQDAIDALSSTGGAIYIKEGTYNITTSILLNKTNLLLSGPGKATKIVPNGDYGIMNASADDCTITQIYFYGTSTGTSQHGIYNNASTSTHMLIKDCWFENLGGHGIFLDGDTRHIVSNCYCSGNDLSGIHLRVVTYSIISGNHCIPNGAYGIHLETIGINGCARNVIDSNNCFSNVTNQITDDDAWLYNVLGDNNTTPV